MQSLRRSGAIGTAMRNDPQLLTYVLLLRYGQVPRHEASQPVMNYASIARLIRKPVTTVIELVKAALAASMHGFSREQLTRSKFSQHHIGYLVSSSTLQECAHLSLVERA
jgi:hypothetical protein